ncbi:helix-turn-helix domain-containing protein [Jeotgalibacillus proteolyticus]|nr:tetratricopeptide repeat protein [Jeotgalibacillus proteolyticus]
MDLGKNIRNYRTALGITQEELAKPNLNRSVISQIESGKIDPSLKTLKQIATSLGVKISDLIEEVEDIEVSQVILLNRSKNFIVKKKYLKAKETLELVSFTDLTPEHKGMYHKIYGILFYSMKNHEAAIQELVKALEYITPTNINDYIEVYSYLVFSYRYTGKFMESINGSVYGVFLLEKFNLSDHNILLYIKFTYNLAVCYCRINQFEDGLLMIEKVNKVSAEYDLYLYGGSLDMLEGIAHLYLGNYRKSIAVSTNALNHFEAKQDYANIVACLTNLAICYRKIDNFDKSIEYLQEAIKICNEHELNDYKNNATFEMALNLFNKQNFRMLLDYVEKDINKEDDFIQAKLKYILAKVYLEKKEFSKAIQELELAISFFKEKNPYWLSECYLLKGTILVDQGNLLNAITYFEDGHKILLKKTGEFLF